MSIGFFDSGIGGLTVLREAVRLLPHENYIYYADTLHVPYGVKPKHEVKKYVFEAADFLAGQGIKMLVVACNTATSIAIRGLREKYSFPVIGMEPAVKPAVEKSGNCCKRVLVTATPLTLKEEKFQNLVARVDQEGIVDTLPLPELVEFAEKFEFREEIIVPYLHDKFSSFDMNGYGTVVLGCTHFPFYRDTFKKLLPRHIDVIDGNSGTVRHMKNVLKERGLIRNVAGKSKITFYHSGKRVNEEIGIRKYFGLLEM